MNPLPEQWRMIVPAALGALAVWMLLPRDGKRRWVLGSLCGLVALVGVLSTVRPVIDDWAMDGLFYLFGGGAVLSGVMMITDRNPIYAALWFALVTLSTCGLFLLNAAPFLSAATIVVYAGAIVVTFVFVIMLAQQAGAATYDRRAFQPMLATCAGFLLLGAILYTIDASGRGGEDARPQFLPRVQIAEVTPNPLSQPRILNEETGETDLGSLSSIGRSLFGDYLFAVELAGTVLLIATIGAIALAPRRAQGHL
ncbi:NADH:ubiquinone oxidoreductase subunit J [bacterium]|nr:NADH:ubiquinone oxidoreductase subunit J [bacterium]